MDADTRAFLISGARLRRGIGVLQRRVARAASASIIRRGQGKAQYDATTHAFVMLDIDRVLDEIYGQYRGDPNGLLVQLIARHSGAAWTDRAERMALLGGGYRDDTQGGPE